MPKHSLILILLLILFLSPSWASQIVKVESAQDRGHDFVDIYTTGYVQPKGFLEDDRLIIEFPQSKISQDIKVVKRKSKRIEKISSQQISSQEAAIVIDLKKDIEYEIVNVFGRNKVVVELRERIDYGKQLMLAWEKANLKEQGDKLKPFKYKKATDNQSLPLNNKTIVIDPGHGGRDPGAMSITRTPEKFLTLQTARKIAKALSQAGASVYLTRNDDRKNSLRDIVAFANKSNADIFISIHYNFINSKSVKGVETYYYTPKSRKLATYMHKSLIHNLKRKDRGLRKAMFYIVHHTNMPAVLLEPLYISNYEEACLASSASFQNKLARSITKGVISYF